MNKDSKSALDLYFAEGDSWATDRNNALRKSRTVAWWVAGGAATIAVLEALAIVMLTPLKTVEPYTLLVDRQTGYVQALKPLDPQLISSDQALTQSFLAQYVIAREGYDVDALQSDYRKVALWSTGAARTAYIAGMQAGNPDSPLSRYPRSTTLEIRVKSINSLSANAAMIRFDTIRRDAGGQARPAQPWVAVVRFSYSGQPMTLADRVINPLGFKVTRYRRSMEALPSSEPVRNTTADTPSRSAAYREVPQSGASSMGREPKE